MTDAWIRGKPAALQSAIEEAARLLGASRMPVIAGLGTDVAGARAAITLARQVGAAVDHMHAAALLRDLDVMREAGVVMTTPGEARVRADLLLLVGPDLREAWPELPARLFARAHNADRLIRRIVWLCPGGAANDLHDMRIETIGSDPAELPVLLSVLRARCVGHPVAMNSAGDLDALAASLAQARYGVAVWSSLALDAPGIEMLCGLVKDLNAKTRFAGLPLAPPDNAAAVQQVAAWMTGFPLPTGFGRGRPEHDPWRFDAVRLVDSGEADCALWVSAYRVVAPGWSREVPLIVLAESSDSFERPPAVVIAVGRPGIDHDAIEHLAATGTLGAISARRPRTALSVADAIGKIAAALPAGQPC